MSTNRPSPSPKGEVSRNTVGVTEVAPNTNTRGIASGDATHLHWTEGRSIHPTSNIYLANNASTH